MKKQKVEDEMEKLLLILLFISIFYYPLCGIVGFIEFAQDRKRGIKNDEE